MTKLLSLSLIAAINVATTNLLAEYIEATGDAGTLTDADPETGLIGIAGQTVDGFKFDYRVRPWDPAKDDEDGPVGRIDFEGDAPGISNTTVVTLPDGETTQTYEQTSLKSALRRAGVASAQPTDNDIAEIIARLVGPAGRVGPAC